MSSIYSDTYLHLIFKSHQCCPYLCLLYMSALRVFCIVFVHPLKQAQKSGGLHSRAHATYVFHILSTGLASEHQLLSELLLGYLLRARHSARDLHEIGISCKALWDALATFFPSRWHLKVLKPHSYLKGLSPPRGEVAVLQLFLYSSRSAFFFLRGAGT